MNGLPIIATKNGAPVEINQVCFPSVIPLADTFFLKKYVHLLHCFSC
jgi:hypothetical protein